MSPISRIISTAAVVLCVIALAIPAHATWPIDGVPVCTQPDTQTWPLILSDGAGGMFVTWADKRNGTHYRPYAQRYDGSGNPVWIRDGVSIGDQSGSLTMLAIISDGAYGAIIFWASDYNEIIAQKIDANGDVQWPGAPNGVAIPVNYPQLVSAIPDGIGGAVLIWQEPNSYLDVRAQRIDTGGNLMWSPAGVFVFSYFGTDEIEPCVIADGSGGAIVAAIVGTRVRARRIYLSGLLWPTAVEVTPTGFLKQHLAMASDGAGGAFITWSQASTTTEGNIYARRIDVAGNALWLDPVPICTFDEDQVHPDIIADGLGNAVIVWEDVRNTDRDIYAQKIDAFGVTLWAYDGETVCEGFGDMHLPQLLPGSGTNVLVNFVGHNAVYAQAIDGAGERVWTDLNAVHVMDVDLSWEPQAYDVNTDGAGGLLTAVMDDRGIGGYDIFARPINSFGLPYRAAPEMETVVDIPGDQGGWVRLGIIPSDRDALTVIDDPVVRYDVWREIQSTALILELSGTATNNGHTRDQAPAPAGVTIIDQDNRRFIDAAPGGVFPHGLWEQLGSFSATQGGVYTYAAPTTADSSASGQADEIFIVTAHTADPAVWFVSDEAHGHSVDNIPPHVPGNFSIAYNVPSLGENRLEWDTSPDPDFKYFRIYRDEDPGFTPSPANYVHGTTDWSWADHVDEGWRYSYKVTAVDMADNESAPAHGTASGTGSDVLPTAVTLEQNVPNPFNPSTSISIGLPTAGHVRLSVYDITGKRVRALVDGPMPAGFRTFTWNGTDDAGNRVSSGVYFYRLEAGGETITKKMLLLK